MLVQELLENMSAEVDDDTAQDNSGSVESDDYKTAIATHVASLPPPRNDNFGAAKLMRVCNSLTRKTEVEVLEELAIYLAEVFPIRKRKSKGSPMAGVVNLPKKQARKVEYARTQDLWRKSRNKCIRMLLDDTAGVKAPPKEVMVPFWSTVKTATEDISPPTDRTEQKAVIPDLWSPITMIEIRKAKPANTISAGPNGLMSRLLKSIPNEILCRILNIIMWCEQAPQQLLESLTILIPKKSGAKDPGDFRPLTVSSVLMRTLHKVLATRMARLIKLDQRQRAFRPTDGCSDNVFLLDMILRHHHKKHKPLYLASLDLAKAFDSVTHKPILETLCMMGLPKSMLTYIRNVYENSSTRLICEGWRSELIRPTCGVKQGDPMSPVIFNMVMDRLLKMLPDDIGAKVGDLTVNAAAFADDVILFASTPLGLQSLLDKSANFLSQCGLKVNASKCLSVAIRNVPHEKKTVVDKDTIFTCRGFRRLSGQMIGNTWGFHLLRRANQQPKLPKDCRILSQNSLRRH